MNKIIISPHLDDAWFDLGGAIKKWREAGFTVGVINIFSIQSWVKGNSLSIEQVTHMRKREEIANARRDGVTLKFLDLPEAQIRGYDLAFPHVINWPKDRNTLNKIVAALDRATSLRKAEIVYFPLGIGGHVDHLLVREASTALSNYLSGYGIQVCYYEDLPYASFSDLPFKFISELNLNPVLEEIDIDHKIAAVHTYESQIDDNVVNSIIEYAYSFSADGRTYERLWMG